MGSRVLIVRLGALGDLVHMVPAVAAIRAAWPDARIDWLVDARYATLLSFVSGFDRAIVIGHSSRASVDPNSGSVSPGGLNALAARNNVAAGSPSVAPVSGTRSDDRVFPGGPSGVWRAVRFLRAQSYDVALDAQGLIKSALLARASGARRVIGFAAQFLREPAAQVCYTETAVPERGVHVVRKNLALVRALGIDPGALRFPITAPFDPELARALPAPGPDGQLRFAILNPGAGWPNKRWRPERFGAVAGHLRDRHGLLSVVTWGPGEQALADAVVRASDGSARSAPATNLGGLIAVIERATLFVAGDTGPLQIAAALGTPIVALFGPTDPARNGPWSLSDVSLSRFDQCDCHHKRRCRRSSACIDDITIDEVLRAVDRRLEA